MSTFAFALVRKVAFRDSCSIKTAALKFLYWFYTSETAATLAASMSFVYVIFLFLFLIFESSNNLIKYNQCCVGSSSDSIPPQQIRTSQGIEALINAGVFCSDALAYPGIHNSTIIN
jgi:hypothetical protein